MENKKNVVSDSLLDRVEEAIENLTTPNWNRLVKAAKSFLYGTGFSDANELINEALCRVLSGGRNWPPNVPFITFFINAMRSIADGERNLVYRAEEVLCTDLTNNDPELNIDPIENFGNDKLSPETIIATEIERNLAEEDLKIIENHFKDNESVGWVLIAIEDQLSASEVIEISGLTKTQYESARKSLLRGLDKLFPGRRIKK